MRMPAETHSYREINREEVRSVLHEHAADIWGVSEAVLSDETPLKEDALGVMELVRRCEEDLAERALGFDIDDEMNEWKTLGDVRAFVEECICLQSAIGTCDV